MVMLCSLCKQFYLWWQPLVMPNFQVSALHCIPPPCLAASCTSLAIYPWNWLDHVQALLLWMWPYRSILRNQPVVASMLLHARLIDLRYVAELLASTFFKASQQVSLTAELVNKPQQLPLPIALQHSVMIIALLCGDACWHIVLFIQI